MEYDFVYPHTPKIQTGDFLHFQWTGSDANPTGNAGNGRQGTDRSNFVEVSNLKTNKPKSMYRDDYCAGLDVGETFGCDVTTEDEATGAKVVADRELDVYYKSMFDDFDTV